MRRTLTAAFFLLLLAIVLPFAGDALFDWGPDDSVLPAHGRLVEIGEGRQLNVYELGEGKPIVLVHGWASCAADWAKLPEKLAALGHRVIVYDRAGYGYSTRIDASYGSHSYESSGRDLLALLDALRIDRATLVGWSFGGGVVQWLASEAPERVESLVLIASVGPGGEEGEGMGLLDWILASPLGSAVLSWVSKVPALSYELTHDGVAQAFSGERYIPTGWTIRTQAMLALPGTFRSVVGEASQVSRSKPNPQSIGAATWVIHGSEDRLVPYSVGEELNRLIAHSALESVVDGSHMLPVTHSDLLAKGIHRLVGSEYSAGALPEAGR